MFSKPKYMTNCFMKFYKIDTLKKKHIRYEEMKQS